MDNDLGEYAVIPEFNEESEYDKNTLRVNELASYGFYISNHPASKYVSNEITKIDKLEGSLFKNVICYVMIENIKRIKTKKNEDMAFISASDETGVGEFTVFPNGYYLLQNLEKNDMIKVWGTVSKRYDKYNVKVNKINKE